MIRYFLFCLFLQLLQASPVKSQLSRKPIFELAFEATRDKMDSIPFYFRKIDLGYIKIESGKLVVCDAKNWNSARPFIQVFPKGKFLVQLSVAKEEGTDEFPAFARIKFSNDSIMTWKYALLPGMKAKSIKDNDFSTCDTMESMGLGIFIDSVINRSLNSKSRKEWENKLSGKIKKNSHWGVANSTDGKSFAAFKGSIEPCYGVLLGYNKNNKICRLVVDLQTLQFPPSIYWGDVLD